MASKTVIFCIFTSVFLCAVAIGAWMIGHNPWGLVTTSLIVLALLVQNAKFHAPSNTVNTSELTSDAN